MNVCKHRMFYRVIKCSSLWKVLVGILPGKTKDMYIAVNVSRQKEDVA